MPIGKLSQTVALVDKGQRCTLHVTTSRRVKRIENSMNLGPTELIIILIIVMLVFGSSRLPKLARSIGQAQKEFKDGVKEGAQDDAETEKKA
jgi:sec-independent protein translocase protein TatA